MTPQERLEAALANVARNITEAFSAAVDMVAERAGETRGPESLPKTQPKRLMTTEEAAEFLGVSVGMLERDRSVGLRRVPCVRIGRAVRYDRRVLEERIADGEFAIPKSEKRGRHRPGQF